MLRNRASISSFPAIWMHQLTRWSLKTPLWSWWRMSGVKQVNMSVCGRSAQNRLYIGLIPSFVMAVTQCLLALCSRITLVRSCSCFGNCTNSPHWSCRTLHSRQWLSLQQATKHCSRKSTTYAARMGNTNVFVSAGNIYSFLSSSTDRTE